MKLVLNGYQLIVTVPSQLTGIQLKQQLEAEHALKSEDYYLISNGKIVHNDNIIIEGFVHLVPRVLGGKGGFGSMLRAIGAQIEKTTNREACRDLSGRRLRDINEEQRLKNWINNQAEREKEAKEKKKKKLERLCEMPKHEFKDEEYDKERSALPELVEDAVLQGLQASSSSKRKSTDVREEVKKKKPKMWMDDELEDLSDDDSEEEQNENKTNEESNHKDENCAASNDVEHKGNSGDSSGICPESTSEDTEKKSDGGREEKKAQNENKTNDEPNHKDDNCAASNDVERKGHSDDSSRICPESTSEGTEKKLVG